MAEHGMLSSAGKPVYLTMNTEKWPPAINWTHLSIREKKEYSFFHKSFSYEVSPERDLDLVTNILAAEKAHSALTKMGGRVLIVHNTLKDCWSFTRVFKNGH